ncbi:MAG: hypothetical protein IRZ16_04160 [Myxococcaceae bacterium]|nr:hypothetical protein [Myxococcaceae bacterium]
MNTVCRWIVGPAAVFLAAAFGCSNPPPPTSGTTCGGAVCEQGQRCDEALQLCVADLAPEVVIETPKANDAFSGDSVEVSGTIIDDAGKLLRAEASISGSDWVALKVADDGKYAATLPLPKLDGERAKLRVRAFDELGQEGVMEVEIQVDNVAPSCSFLSPADGELIGGASGGTFEVKFKADDGSKSLQVLELAVDGARSPDPLPATVGMGTWSWMLNSTDNDVSHTLALHVVDAAGHACDAEVTARVDLVAPQLSLTAPAEEPDPFLVGGPGVESLTFVGSASDGTNARPSVTIDFADGSGPREVQWTMESGSEFSLEVPLAVENFVSHDVVIRAVDAAGNASTINRTIVVDRVAPSLTITFPAEGQRFNLADLAGNTNVVVTWNAHDGDPEFSTYVRILPDPTPTLVTGTSMLIPTQPTDTPSIYAVELSALDVAGNTVTQQVSFSVDRVAPHVVSITPAANTRMNEPSMTLVFNEPVTFQPGATLLNPPVTLPTTTATSFTIPLANYTTYTTTFAAGLVVDGYGNPSTASNNLTFQTAPAQPNPATFALAIGSNPQDDERFDATADEDGVVTIAFRSTKYEIALGEIDPVSGNYTLIDTFSSPGIVDLRLASHRELGPTPPSTVSMTPLRYRGFGLEQKFLIPNMGPHTFYAVFVDPTGTATQVTNNAAAIVPVPGGCADPAGDPMAYIDVDGVLHRATSSGEYTQAAPFNMPLSVAPHSRQAWVGAGYDSSFALKISERRCGCGQPPFGTFCNFSPSYTVGASATLTSGVVVPDNGKFAIATYAGSGSTDVEWCVPLCNTSNPIICFPKAQQTSARPPNEGLRLGRHLNPDKILGARRNGSGVLELVERQVTTGCFDNNWSVIATAPGSVSSAASVYKPLMFGKKPGVLYLLDGSTLRVWIP